MAFAPLRLTNRLPSGTALVLYMTSTAFAQDAAPFDLGTIVLSPDPAQVRERDENGEAADRAGAIYVSDAELERARMGDVKDLFSELASVSVGGAIPVAQKIFVNGVDMLNLTIQLDGVQQNNRAFHHASANAFDPGLLKFVRVDPGVAPADAGPNAVAGAVIMESIDATDILRDGRSVGGNLRLSYGDNGETFSTAVTAGFALNGFEALIYGKYANGEDFEDGNGDTVTGTAANLQSGLIKLAYEGDSGHRFEFSTQRLEDAALRNFRANFGPGPQPLVRYDTKRTNVSLRYEHTKSEGFWDPEVVLGFSESQIDAPLFEDSQGTSNTLMAKFQNNFHIGHLGVISAGVDFTNKRSEYTSDVSPLLREKTDNTGVFAQARLEPTERLDISAGLRYDWQDFTGKDGYSDSDSGASGNISAVFDITEAFAVRAGYSNVFGGYQLEDNYVFFSPWNYTMLRTSRAENIVIGADWRQGNLAIGGELFRTTIDDARNGDTNFDFESEGYNLKATYGWNNGFARLTYSHSDVTANGTPADSFDVLDFGAPLGDVIALTVQQKFPEIGLTVGGNLDVALDYTPNVVRPYAVQGFDGYEVLNLFAEYTPRQMKNVTLRAEVQNVFDESFSDRATYGGDYPGFATLNEPGRTLVLTAVAHF
ncbi:TonB-dependent receptor [uncultured Roseovarius sp.]|uniref:TonB-dependent receptor domain-containing protein n=1 Tax=uncultured Roseovarius sp. TaxID=293344 RepID=UPI00261A1F5B|nr:TonB-dependent receptor [uncultured Roseovarius sp.]